MGRLVWSQRPRVYLVGVTLLVVATVLYTIGHVAPYWVRADPALNIGIWFLCPDNGSCFEHSFASDADYLKATRILQVLGLVGLVGAIGVSMFQNCRRVHPGTSYILEAVIAVSAIIGFSGVMVYVGYSRENIEMFPDLRYDWALALNVAACILALIAALLIFCPKICCNDNDNNGDNNDTDARSLQSSRQQGSSSYLEGGGKGEREGTLQRRFSGAQGPYLGFYRGGGPYWRSSVPYWKSGGLYQNGGGGFHGGKPLVDWSGPPSSSLLSGPYTTYYGLGQYVPTPPSPRQRASLVPPPLEDYHSEHGEEPSRYVVNPLAPRPGLVQVLPRTPHPSNLTAFRREVIELQPPQVSASTHPAAAFSHRRMRNASGGSDAARGVDSASKERPIYEGRGVSLDSLPPLEILVPSGAPPPPPVMELTLQATRVVVRGYYDPATGGYPEYMMM